MLRRPPRSTLTDTLLPYSRRVLFRSMEDNAWSTVELASTEFGRLDGAFNNAGLPPVNVPLHQLTSADFQRSLDINVLGVFHCMKHQIAAMLKAGSGGSIVNTASVGGTVAIPAHGEYI